MKNDKIAIIGAGVSGLSSGIFLKNKGFEVTIFEKCSQPGGLIKCKRVNGSLYHICGGHIFNSKRQDVLDWFWSVFDKEKEFALADRNSVVLMPNGGFIPYPIENHMYMFDKQTQNLFIKDLLKMSQNSNIELHSFEDFLRHRFGETLYNLYFKPYNEKVWRRDLTEVPLTWLEGKLPMPSVEEIIYNNMNHVKEKSFVHSTFWYEKKDGSQFLANKLAEGLNIKYNVEIKEVEYSQMHWNINGETFSKVIFCGNIKDLPKILKGVSISSYADEIERLEFHGTTSVFCEIDKNSYSWIYLPDQNYDSHRIICTGNFAQSNNAEGKNTATIEFTDYLSKDDILSNLQKIPGNPVYLDHTYNKYTYPIQKENTREMIARLKNLLSSYNFHLTGRFADWEYYNMDVAMGAAMDLCEKIN